MANYQPQRGTYDAFYGDALNIEKITKVLKDILGNLNFDIEENIPEIQKKGDLSPFFLEINKLILHNNINRGNRGLLSQSFRENLVGEKVYTRY